MNSVGPARHRPRKRFGQNFLVDRGIVAKILTAIDPKPEDQVVEIGPGLGALTEPLLARLTRLDVVEIDRDLAGRLAARFSPERLRIHPNARAGKNTARRAGWKSTRKWPVAKSRLDTTRGHPTAAPHRRRCEGQRASKRDIR